jgi:hypothetical protein
MFGNRTVASAESLLEIFERELNKLKEEISLYPDEKKVGSPLFSAADAVDLYVTHGGSIFKSDFKNSLTNINRRKPN